MSVKGNYPFDHIWREISDFMPNAFEEIAAADYALFDNFLGQGSVLGGDRF